MASYTTNLNLEMPTVNEKYDVLKQNQNWQKVDDFAGSVSDEIATKGPTQITSEEFSGSIYISKSGNTVTVSFESFKKSANGLTANAIIPSGYRPTRYIRCCCLSGNADNNNLIGILTTGVLDVTAEDVLEYYYGTVSYVV